MNRILLATALLFTMILLKTITDSKTKTKTGCGCGCNK